MILCFPNLPTLHLVTTSTILPTDASMSSAKVHYADGGQIYVDTPIRVARRTANELSKLGVSAVKTLPEPQEAVLCWPQILPLQEDRKTIQFSTQTTVLFELQNLDDLPRIVQEMLRLGHDRQSIRWLIDPERPDSPRVLLRVVGPPYYTLLRAMDQSSNTHMICAYVEQAPRVWVQLGFSHPVAKLIHVAEDQFVLLRSPRDWQFVAEEPFQDIYDILEFQLPKQIRTWQEYDEPDSIEVPLSLRPGNAADLPEMWVLRNAALVDLDRFVRDSDERTLQRLKFAVAKDESGSDLVVVRVSPSKLAPPTLVLPGALALKPYFKLPNLFVPVGMRLHPQLRRDAVRGLLADDPDQVVWLTPTTEGAFQPESISEDAFQPLTDWVDYIIAQNEQTLQAWVAATQFEFRNFICGEGQIEPPAKPDTDRKGKRKPSENDPPLAVEMTKSASYSSTPSHGPVVPVVIKSQERQNADWLKIRSELEEQYKSQHEQLDAAARSELWVKLARANAALEDLPEAAVCWLNGIWGQDTIDLEVLQEWACVEWDTTPLDFPSAEIERILRVVEPTRIQLRKLLTYTFFQILKPTVDEGFAQKVLDLQSFFAKHESKMPARATWLLASEVSRWSGSDVLGLARARDRILQRLLEQGLNSEIDLPFFLRSAGLKDSDRVRQIRDRFGELHQLARQWVQRSHVTAASGSSRDNSRTLPYVDLFFAFGFARLGESTQARKLLQVGVTELNQEAGEERVAAKFLAKALYYRVEQNLAGQPHGGPYSKEIQREWEEIQNRGNQPTPGNNPWGIAKFAIERFQEMSRILSPHEQLDPFSRYDRNDELSKTLADLENVKDPNELTRRLRQVFRASQNTHTSLNLKCKVLSYGLNLSSRVGEALVVEFLHHVPEALQLVSATADLESLKKVAKLIERSIFYAAHYDRRDLVQQFTQAITRLIRTIQIENRYRFMSLVANQSFRSLRKLGLRDEIDQLLKQFHEEILKNQSVAQVRNQYLNKADMWSAILESLLSVAGAWLTIGELRIATTVLEQVQQELVESKTSKFANIQNARLAVAYFSALSQAPPELALERISDFLNFIPDDRIQNSFTTARFYSRLHLNVIEELVLAIVNDDFALSPTGRRWLDDDESIVRRRIHADMRLRLSGSGL